jgi:hypothetical protein
MKIRFNHLNGQYGKHSIVDLCEVYGTPEEETDLFLFENGWLPTTNNEWFQSRSSRVKIAPISSRRKYQLRKISVTTVGNYSNILKNSKCWYDANCELFLDTMLSYDHQIYYFDDAVFAVLNWFNNIPYFSVVIGGRERREGITPLTCYYFLNKLTDSTYPYLYIGPWYDEFFYKAHYPGFEWWDGGKWNNYIS